MYDRGPMSVQTTAAPPRQHLAWLDVTKGAGIAMVVLGHVTNIGFGHFFVFTFHMPLFFFVSGFLHRVDLRFKAYARKKAITLLVPYLTFLLAISLLKLPHLAHNFTPHRIAHALLLLAWGGSKLRGAFGSFWFLSCLYLTQQVMNYLLARFSTRVVVIVVLAGLCLSYVNYLAFPNLTLPLDANVVLAAAPFYFAGSLFRGRNVMNWRYSLFAVFCVTTVSALIARGTPAYGSAVYMTMKDNVYGVIFISQFLALGCIIGTFQLAQALPSQTLCGRALTRLGLLSLPIMFIHAEILNGPAAHAVRRYGTLVGFVLTLVVSWLVAEVMMRAWASRALFMGSLPDFERLITSRNTNPAQHNPLQP